MLALVLLITIIASAQSGEENLRKIPSVTVKTIDGRNFNTANIENDGKPIILSFWALWCKPCMRELTAIAEVYEDWVAETGVKLIAVSIDDTRSTSRVLPTVQGRHWEYEVLLDANGDFRRAMNVNHIPHNFIINGQGEIVWQHTSFAEGSQHMLIDLVRRLNAGEDISGH